MRENNLTIIGLFVIMGLFTSAVAYSALESHGLSPGIIRVDNCARTVITIDNGYSKLTERNPEGEITRSFFIRRGQTRFLVKEGFGETCRELEP